MYNDTFHIGTKYKTKSLVYSLIAANALKRQLPEKIHKAIERHLWNCQDKDGGLWTEYTEKGVSENARKNNELAPLTLLAYDHKIWS